ncbi:MAG: YesL family protein [Erysipelotrichaceae bacterium]|jgi:uncharacterized membrane protein YesL|nr:YesL family protein [Erysipelotrichaceae bacterium]
MNDKRNESLTERFAGRLTNIVLLGFFTTLCSLPVITAGAAFTSLNVATKAYLYDDDDKPLRIFFSSFKEVFPLATKVWLLHVPVLAILVWDIVYYRTSDATLDILAAAAIFVLLVFVILEMQMVFVLIGKNRTRKVWPCIKMALDISANCFWHCAMLLLFTASVIAVSLFIFRGLLLVMPGVIAFINWQFIPEILRRYRFREQR